MKSAVQNAFNEKDRQSATNLINSQSSSQSSLNSMQGNSANNLNDPVLNNQPTLAQFQRTVAARQPRQQSLPTVNMFTQRTLSYYGPREQPVVPQGFFQWSVFVVAFPFKLILTTLVDIANAFCKLLSILIYVSIIV